jgi:hypothetical protein
MPGSGNPCIYCERPADSEEHILATWLIDELERCTGRNAEPGQLEQGGVVVPVSVTLNAKGKRQFNFTSDTICRDCNGVWMNQVDERARSYLRKLVCGQSVPTTRKMRNAVASWAVKTAITTRFAHINPDPVEGEWAEQLRTDNRHLPSPLWFVWLARYVGGQDLWLRQAPLAIRGVARLDGGPELNPPDFSDGVLMTLAIGQLCVQVLRINGPAFPVPPEDATTVVVWPNGPVASWPPAQPLDDSSLEPFAERFNSESMVFGVERERPPEGSSNAESHSLFTAPITPELIASDDSVFNIGFDCQCGTHTEVPYDTGAPFRDLKLPYTAEVSYVCPGCGTMGGGKITVTHIPRTR